MYKGAPTASINTRKQHRGRSQSTPRRLWGMPSFPDLYHLSFNELQRDQKQNSEFFSQPCDYKTCLTSLCFLSARRRRSRRVLHSRFVYPTSSSAAIQSQAQRGPKTSSTSCSPTASKTSSTSASRLRSSKLTRTGPVKQRFRHRWSLGMRVQMAVDAFSTLTSSGRCSRTPVTLHATFTSSAPAATSRFHSSNTSRRREATVVGILTRKEDGTFSSPRG